MTRAEFIKLIREGKEVPDDVELPAPTIHVRAAEGYIPRIAGLDARSPTLSKAELGALLKGPAASQRARARNGDHRR
jgi:hypothetical protein